MELRELTAFVNCIYQASNIGIDTYEFKNKILDHFNKNPEYYFERQWGGGYQSHNNFGLDEETVAYLKEKVEPVVIATLQRWGITKPTKMLQYWVNIEGDGVFGTNHVHRNSLLTAVYYVSVPKGAGDIVFYRPDPQLHYYYADESNPHTYKTYTVVPEEDDLVLFPPYLQHRTNQNKMNNGEHRISIAFDYHYIEPEIISYEKRIKENLIK